MRYYVMWHSEKEWGGRGPVLFKHKAEAVKGTGLTLGQMRGLGWRWINVEITPPGREVTTVVEFNEVCAEIQRLVEMRALLYQTMTEQERKEVRPPGAAGTQE